MIARVRAQYDKQPRPIPRVRTAKATMRLTLLDAMRDPMLFGPFFANREEWAAWEVVIAALFGLPMSPDMLVIYRDLTGREHAPTSPATEAWLCIGRRAGKSRILALIATWMAAFHDYSDYLSAGERGLVLLLAQDRTAAKIALSYVRAFVTKIPMLAGMIVRETQDGFGLSNDITITIGTSNYKSVRGPTCCFCAADEIAWWADENSSNPAEEVLNALRPAMATVPSALMICASSPYSRRGALYEAHKTHFGRDLDPVLVFQGETRKLNSTVPQEFIDGEYARDPANASAEFGAIFRSDVTGYVDRAAVSACVSDGVFERAPMLEIKYVGFTDCAGGSGSDSWTAAVAYRDGKQSILAAVREIKPPFSPEATANELSSFFRSFNISNVIGDRYAGDFPRELFRKNGISYTPSKRSASEIYVEFLPLINSGTVDLLDHTKLFNQIVSLERKTGGSKDRISHPPQGHDDVANSAAGAIVHLDMKAYRYDSSLNWVMGDVSAEEASRSWQKDQLFGHMQSPHWGLRGRRY